MKATCLSRFGLLLAGVFLLCPGRILLAQASQAEPSAYTAAMERLAQGDTAGAIAGLRLVTRSNPRFGPAFLKLGALLSAQAGEAEANYERRLAAREALARAADLMPNDPFVLLEYGLLLRRQQMRADAVRVLERAERAAERRAAHMSPSDVSQLHIALGRIYETWWEDFEQLILFPEAYVGELRCPNYPGPLPGAVQSALALMAIYCPRQWNAAVRSHVVPLEDLRSDERASMIAHYRLALAVQPGNLATATRLLGFIVDDGAWEEYDALVRRLRAARPQDSRIHLFAGLGLHERGRDTEADSAFREAMSLLSPSERSAFNDISPILGAAAQARYAALDSAGRDRVAQVFFVAQDPMFLSGAEERRLEHYARLAWAELKFGDPVSGNRGWNTDRGETWIRYGRPRKIVQCCFAEGGRMVFWSYGPDGPVFVFHRQLTYRYSRFTEDAEVLAEHIEARTPEWYQPVGITSDLPVPHQIARFLGAVPGQTRTEIYAAFPVDSLLLGPGDSVQAGVFLFDQGYRPVVSRLHKLGPRASGEVNYNFDLLPSTYRYGMEARAPGPETEPRPLARVRDTMVVSGFPPGRLAVSDLLLADSVSARVPNPVRRSDMFVRPSRTLEFGREQPLHVYFEVYNLGADADSLWRYRMELAVEDSTRRTLLARVVRGLRELVRPTPRQAVLEWQRTVRAVGERAVDYFMLEAPPFQPGVYSVRLRVTDEVTGATAESRRLFRVP